MDSEEVHRTKQSLPFNGKPTELTEDDQLISLRDACEIFFAGRGVTVASLKAEHERGNLDLSKIGRAYFTTIADLKEMKKRCHVDHQVRNSGSTKNADRGPSSTADGEVAQASALQRLEKRKRHLGITSRRSTR